MKNNFGEFQVAGSLRRRLNQLAVEVALTPLQRILTPVKLARNRGKAVRWLEIGPGSKRIPGFETLNIIGGPQVDYVANAVSKLPFPDRTFDVIYASHIIEHIPWYQLESAISEWARKLKPGGLLEIWTPDGLKIAKAFVDAEERGTQSFTADGWWRFNDSRDPCVWYSGRLFSYGDGTGKPNHYNWHRSTFSARFLSSLLERAGLRDIRRMEPDEVRGFDHGWINLGIQGKSL